MPPFAMPGFLAGRLPGPASLAAAALLLALAPLLSGHWLGARAATAAIDFAQVGCDALALAFAFAAWRARRPGDRYRPALAAFAALLALLLLADTAWAWVDAIRGEDPSGSPVNWLYLPFYPLLLVTVLWVPRALAGRGDRWRLGLDALLVALGLGLLLWDRLAQPHLAHVAPSDPALTVFVLLGQPLLDGVAALALGLLLLRLPPGAQRAPLVWLALGIGTNLVGNLLLAVFASQGGFVSGGLADVLWIVSRWAFLAAAEGWFRHAEVDAPPAADAPCWQPAFASLPYLAVLCGYGTVLADALDEGVSRANLFGALLLTALVLLRQAVDRRQAERLLAERARRAGEARLAALVQHASEAILVLDATHRIGYASPAAAVLLGHPAAALEGQPIEQHLHPEERTAAAALLAEAARGGDARPTLLRLRGARGVLWCECTVTDLLARPDVGGIVLNVRDVTAQRELEEQLRHQSFHDPLTGLVNRLLFGERISEALTVRGEHGRGLAVMFIDLDHFKVVNDSLGHASGDEVIAQAAQRLEGTLRPGDVLARLGGDEFAVLLQELDDDAAVVAAAGRAIEAFRAPFRLDGREVPLSASLGIAWAGPGDTVDMLLRNADLALNEAKARGRDRFHVFQPDLHAAVLRKLRLHAALRELLERGALALAYQPIVRLGDLAPIGVEALLRWPDDAEVEASPADAVAAAEESGLIVPLGRWVLERALADMRRLRELHGLDLPLRLTVNLSARQLHDPGLVGVVAESLASNAFPAAQLVLELTETAVAERSEATLAALHRLKALGLRLAIDDFGTGWSSLAHLAHYPFDLLKVAKPFVDMIGPDGDAHSARLAHAVLALGGSLRLQTIAEGIEHPHQLEVLRAAGCDLAQGFLLGHPLPLEQLVPWLRGSHSTRRTALAHPGGPL